MRTVASALRSQSIEHRFILSGNKQQLILLRGEDRQTAQVIIDQWTAGALPAPVFEQPKSSISINAKPAPLTLTLIFLGFVGFALAEFDMRLIHPFTFWDSSRALFLPFLEFSPWLDIGNGQIWRLITPIFLHFGAIHIIFNALWIWYLGTMLEFNQGRIATLVLVLIIGVTSNSAQAMVSEGIIFGGLSGVVHGLFAYCWLWGRLHKDSSVQLSSILFVVVTALMLLSPLGLFDIIVGGEIADTAHISGYTSGIAAALVITFLQRTGLKIGSR